MKTKISFDFVLEIKKSVKQKGNWIIIEGPSLDCRIEIFDSHVKATEKEIIKVLQIMHKKGLLFRKKFSPYGHEGFFKEVGLLRKEASRRRRIISVKHAKPK